jgi:hypothetical protein
METDKKERMYHIISINDKTGEKAYFTTYPMDHNKCCTMMGKITKYPFRTVMLEEVR